jgi:hypothetical protein
MIWYLIRPLCVADFLDHGDLTITGPLCDFRYKRWVSLPFIHPGGIFKRRGEHLHDAGRQLV